VPQSSAALGNRGRQSARVAVVAALVVAVVTVTCGGPRTHCRRLTLAFDWPLAVAAIGRTRRRGRPAAANNGRRGERCERPSKQAREPLSPLRDDAQQGTAVPR